jgi:hypothetical protein
VLDAGEGEEIVGGVFGFGHFSMIVTPAGRLTVFTLTS